MQRLKALADAEAARLVVETNVPITAIDHAARALFVAEGYAGDPQPVLVAGTRAALQDARRAVAPALERYGRAKEAAGMARAVVEATYGADVAGFASGEWAPRSHETVAARAAAEARAAEKRRDVENDLRLDGVPEHQIKAYADRVMADWHQGRALEAANRGDRASRELTDYFRSRPAPALDDGAHG